MDSRFNLGDIVEFEGNVYKINNIYFLNPQIKSDPYVCRIVKLGEAWNYVNSSLLVREGLLKKLDKKTVKVLYGSC